MSPSSSPFPYKPFDTTVDSIRLLRLGGNFSSGEASYELIHTTFASKPKYEALSYTWGPPEPVETITINGYEVRVRESLYWALVNLRRGVTQRLSWVDEICIN